MNVPYKALNFDLGEELDMLRDMATQFAQSEIAPRAQDIDQSNEFPVDLWKKLGELGLLGITVEAEYGGSEMGRVPVTRVLPSRASAAIRSAVSSRPQATRYVQASRMVEVT